jgi:hypothetical protein
MSLRSSPVLLAAAAAAASIGVMGQSAEVMLDNTRPPGLGAWLTRNNRRRVPKTPRVKSLLNKRLARATGPGSYDDWKRDLAEKRAHENSAGASAE